MPLHYFHTRNGVTTLDHRGVDLADIDAVRAEAVMTFANMLLEDNVDVLWDGKPLRLWVTDGPDDSGETLLVLQVNPDQLLGRPVRRRRARRRKPA
ncbi:MAG: hypothetical protein ABSE22_08220 [Xanthobacteraceae bacterium]|jgi:hypothetical protein